MKSAPKPAHLLPRYGAQFEDASVARAYRHRPPYPPELVERLLALAGAVPPRVLDLGCGTGELSRALAPRAARVDAVDPSDAMRELGRSAPGGDHPHLHWHAATAEAFDGTGPYDLVLAAESFHWMEWELLFDRLRSWLAPSGVLALVERSIDDVPWWPEVQALISRHSTNREFRPYDLLDELASRGLFEPTARERFGPERHRQAVEDYVESFHSRNGFSRERMTEASATAFDAAVAECVAPFASDGALDLEHRLTLCWGRPAPTS